MSKDFTKDILKAQNGDKDVLQKIVEEEVFEYLAGAIDIDTCIERIQNRASIWISEQS